MVQQARKSFVWGWIVLIVAFLGHGLVMGILTYSYPVIFPAMVTANGWSRGDASMAMTVGSWLGLAAYPLAGMALKKFGARKIIAFGSIGIGVVWVLLGQVSEMWHWFALRSVGWAVLAPFASTAAFTTIVVTWFNLRRGIAVGTIFVGYSAFGFFIGPVTQTIMSGTGSWKMGWAVMGAIMVVSGIVSALLLRSKPSDVGTYPDGLTPEEAKARREAAMAGKGGITAVANTYRSSKDWGVGEAIRTRQFWAILACYAGFAGGSFSFSQVGFIGAAKGIQPMDVAFALSLSALAALPWRFIGGWMADRVEARWIMFTGQIITTLALVALWTVPQGNTWWLWTWAILNGTGSAGLTNTLLSIITSNYFGAKNFPTIFASAMMPIGGMVTGLAPGLSGYIYDFTKSYDYAFMVFIGILVIAGLAQLVNSPPKIKEAAPAPAGVS